MRSKVCPTLCTGRAGSFLPVEPVDGNLLGLRGAGIGLTRVTAGLGRLTESVGNGIVTESVRTFMSVLVLNTSQEARAYLCNLSVGDGLLSVGDGDGLLSVGDDLLSVRDGLLSAGDGFTSVGSSLVSVGESLFSIEEDFVCVGEICLSIGESVDTSDVISTGGMTVV